MKKSIDDEWNMSSAKGDARNQTVDVKPLLSISRNQDMLIEEEMQRKTEPDTVNIIKSLENPHTFDQIEDTNT